MLGTTTPRAARVSLSLKLSDTRVYEPQIQAHLGRGYHDTEGSARLAEGVFRLVSCCRKRLKTTFEVVPYSLLSVSFLARKRLP